MNSRLEDTEKSGETHTAKCYYTGLQVETPNDVDTSISRHAVLKKIANGKTRLTE